MPDGQGEGQLLADVAAGLVDDGQAVGVGVLGEADVGADGRDDGGQLASGSPRSARGGGRSGRRARRRGRGGRSRAARSSQSASRPPAPWQASSTTRNRRRPIAAGVDRARRPGRRRRDVRGLVAAIGAEAVPGGPSGSRRRSKRSSMARPCVGAEHHPARPGRTSGRCTRPGCARRRSARRRRPLARGPGSRASAWPSGRVRRRRSRRPTSPASTAPAIISAERRPSWPTRIAGPPCPIARRPRPHRPRRRRSRRPGRGRRRRSPGAPRCSRSALRMAGWSRPSCRSDRGERSPGPRQSRRGASPKTLRKTCHDGQAQCRRRTAEAGTPSGGSTPAQIQPVRWCGRLADPPDTRPGPARDEDSGTGARVLAPAGGCRPATIGRRDFAEMVP